MKKGKENHLKKYGCFVFMSKYVDKFSVLSFLTVGVHGSIIKDCDYYPCL